MVAEAALTAARIDDGGMIEAGHAELLWLRSASSAQTDRPAEITRFDGNDNGPSYRALTFARAQNSLRALTRGVSTRG